MFERDATASSRRWFQAGTQEQALFTEATLKLRRNTPLNPLADRLRALLRDCVQFDVATAFVSDDAVSDLIESAVDSGVSVRFLTGTFGSATRQKTFRSLLNLQDAASLQSRIWSCGTHRNFHGKLYLWRLRDGRGVAWIGSANFTNSGLQSDGELILEVTGGWNSSPLKTLRTSFEQEWKRGSPLTDAFVTTYRQAERTPADFVVRKSAAVIRAHAPFRRRVSKAFVVSVRNHISDDSPTGKRVRTLLGGTADNWLRHFSKKLRKLRPGRRGVVIDTLDKTIAIVEVTDSVRDGSASVFSYVSAFRGADATPWSKKTRRILNGVAGFRDEIAPRTRFLVSKDFKRLVSTLFPRKRATL